MKNTITNAAEITILNVIDNTFKTGGGPVSVGGTVVIASKGPVGVVTQVRDENWQDIFGKPLTKKTTGMEGLRHLADATPYCNYVNVVRVVDATAKFPSLAFAFGKDTGDWEAGDYVVGDLINHTDTTTVLRCIADCSTVAEPAAAGTDVEWEIFTIYETADAEAYGTTLTLAASDLMLIAPVDGDPSVNRAIEFENIDTVKERFDIVITDKDSLGDTYTLESFTVGVNPDDVDDMGRPAYIETVFEQQSDLFSCDWNEDLAWADALETLQAIEDTVASPKSFAFVGGTNGGEPTTENWTDAWDLLKNESITVNLLFAAGSYDTDVVANIAAIADLRHCAAFADIPPYLPHDEAITWLTDAGITSRHMRAYHSPFSASDPWRGGKTVWGVSGAAVASKAICNAIFTGSVPGVHYAPAGAKRGMLKRTGVKSLFPDDIINRDDLYTARINPVIAFDTGGAVIDDDLTLHYMQNYSRFGWVNDILDYIDHRFLEAAGYAKFEPDGLTYKILNTLTKEILEQLVTSGALVPPRNPAEDGSEPFILTIKQLEIDLWHVEWAICPTGSARRIAGQPVLIK